MAAGTVDVKIASGATIADVEAALTDVIAATDPTARIAICSSGKAIIVAGVSQA